MKSRIPKQEKKNHGGEIRLANKELWAGRGTGTTLRRKKRPRENPGVSALSSLQTRELGDMGSSLIAEKKRGREKG